jgi:hypothetical protein
VSRVFVSHSSKDNRQAEALRAWLIAQDPPLANEIFLDTDASTGLKAGMKWKNELMRTNSRCEAVICLLSRCPLGSGSTVFSGTSLDGSKSVSVLLFTEGKTFTRCEITSDPGDPVSTDFLVPVGQRQDERIKASGVS